VPTILINNAAILNGKSILELSEEELERYERCSIGGIAILNVVQKLPREPNVALPYRTSLSSWDAGRRSGYHRNSQ
jgi:hypothetical protein